jgi:hypothetical protein
VNRVSSGATWWFVVGAFRRFLAGAPDLVRQSVVRLVVGRRRPPVDIGFAVG